APGWGGLEGFAGVDFEELVAEGGFAGDEAGLVLEVPPLGADFGAAGVEAGAGGDAAEAVALEEGGEVEEGAAGAEGGAAIAVGDDGAELADLGVELVATRVDAMEVARVANDDVRVVRGVDHAAVEEKVESAPGVVKGGGAAPGADGGVEIAAPAGRGEEPGGSANDVED